MSGEAARAAAAEAGMTLAPVSSGSKAITSSGPWLGCEGRGTRWRKKSACCDLQVETWGLSCSRPCNWVSQSGLCGREASWAGQTSGRGVRAAATRQRHKCYPSGPVAPPHPTETAQLPGRLAGLRLRQRRGGCAQRRGPSRRGKGAVRGTRGPRGGRPRGGHGRVGQGQRCELGGERGRGVGRGRGGWQLAAAHVQLDAAPVAIARERSPHRTRARTLGGGPGRGGREAERGTLALHRTTDAGASRTQRARRGAQAACRPGARRDVPRTCVQQGAHGRGGLTRRLPAGALWPFGGATSSTSERALPSAVASSATNSGKLTSPS